MVAAPAVAETKLVGPLSQGNLIMGKTAPGSTVTLDGRRVRVTSGGTFIIGFARDAEPKATLVVTSSKGARETRTLAIAKRTYKIQRIDGLPPKMVTPPPETLARIKRDRAEIKAARAHDTPEPMFLTGWAWPAKGPISGVYGSQRILNGKPRWPHFGVDVAAPEGTPVTAPADGIVRLAVTDHYYTGGTVILDHGHGLNSAFLHMATVTAVVGRRIKRGQKIGTIGATGRATGPHLDWRINWYDRRVDPQPLAGPMR